MVPSRQDAGIAFCPDIATLTGKISHSPSFIIISDFNPVFDSRMLLPTALIVSSAFPPLGSPGGTIRLVKFLKFMAGLGWKFIVFTQDVERTISPEPASSGFLLDELPADIVLRRIPAPFSHTAASVAKPNLLEKTIAPVYKKLFGDSALPWGLRVVCAGLLSMYQTKVDIIFGTGPPFTNALIAMLLGSLSRRPFILDLRDDWVGQPVFNLKNSFRQRLEANLERSIIRRASAVVTVTQQSHLLYKERYAYLGRPEMFQLITNGCDLDEYAQLDIRKREVASEKFLILSAAGWYRKGHRDIGPFLSALAKLLKRRPEIRSMVDIVFLGDGWPVEYEQLVADLNLRGVIKQTPVAARPELIEWLWKADLFLLMQPAGNTTAISGTLYEYWATGKAPTLLVADDGASSRLVRENRIGMHFHFDQTAQISEYVEEIFNAYASGRPIWIENQGIQRFDRKLLAKQMADLWLKAIQRPH